MRYTLKAGKYTAQIDTVGATLASFSIDGTNVLLGYKKGSDLLESTAYLGATVGPYTNRIRNAEYKFRGKKVRLDKNDGPNNLHAGKKGFCFKNWKVMERGKDYIVLTARTLKVEARITYKLSSHGRLEILYEAVPENDMPMSFTNHAYFNLDGLESTDLNSHDFKLNCNRYLPVGEGLIPTGEVLPVDKTFYEFSWGPRGLEGRMFDTAFIAIDESRKVKEIAEARSRKTGITLKVASDQPSVQFYTGAFLGGQKKPDGTMYVPGSAFCLECQQYPDFVNNPNFPQSIAKAGKVWKTKIVYTLGKEK